MKRFVIVAAVLGSSMAFVDSTVVNVALVAMGRELDADFTGFQWTVDAYLLTLSAFILLGGSLGDLVGRRRVFIAGLVGFASASFLCGIAPSVAFLIAARGLQGLGAALLVPGSLALISIHFPADERGRAIGTWSAWSALTTASGPLLGGWLIEYASWRWVFFINLPIAAGALFFTLHGVSADRPAGGRKLDALGAFLIAAALTSLVFGLIELPARGLSNPIVGGSLAAAAVFTTAFVAWQRHTTDPMVPLDLLRTPSFVTANLVTFLVYFGFGGVLFLMLLELQIVTRLSALAAGLALLPITMTLTALSPVMGRLSDRFGPLPWVISGCLVVSVGFVFVSNFGRDTRLVPEVLLSVTVIAIGMAFIVAPLTAMVFQSVDVRNSGAASGVNNAVTRLASLVAVAVLPLAGRFAADPTSDPAAFERGFSSAVLWATVATILAAGVAVFSRRHVSSSSTP